jgi:membrane protein DedA with SNARE-associated domain
VIAAIVERLIDFLQPLYASVGYLIVGLGVFFERSIFIGLIVPGDIILALGGVYASQGKLNVVAVAVIGTVAAICGESAGYWLGRTKGVSMIRRIPYLNRFEHRLEDAERYFDRRGGWTVALGRYATAAGAFIPFVAGMSRMPYGRFLLFDIPAIVVWAVAITWFGYAFGEHVEFVDRALSRFGYGVLGLLAAFFLGRWLWKRWQNRKAELPPPVGRQPD